jgi:cell division protein FtsL
VLRIINLAIVIAILVTAMLIIRQRFIARSYYIELNRMQNQTVKLNEEYSRLRLEEGTYSSGLAVSNFAANKLGLVQPDVQHVVDLKK